MPTEANQQPEEFPSQCFLGWDAPILELVVERLLSEHRDGASWDLRKLTVVLPSSLAKRRLAELLSFRAEQDNVVLFPPNISLRTWCGFETGHDNKGKDNNPTE